MPVIKRRVDKKRKGNGWWSEKERFNVVAAYLLLGKIGLVAASTGVPELTIRKWRMAPWWKETEDEIKRSSKIELSGKLGTIINKSIEGLEDRVVNGDFKWNSSTRKFERVPIGADTLNKIAGNLIDRSLVLEKEATKEVVSQETVNDRLTKLMEEMIRFSKQKKLVQTIPIEGDYTKEISDAPSQESSA